ncbi:hypothetical protein RN001_009401 [Aquatica leii]|uniref:Vacuolar protein sorting-associated protein 45 n=1 Tax=Aquatica leii TaxID=1421715 RepID=A0AAN7NZK2_9COLE|nr:hypothetical protein RN001_009401 [Aquatica leii]
MNVIGAVKAYITKMVEESEPGMKILVMDKETTSVVSMVFSQSEIQQKEVFLLERIDLGSKNFNSGLRYLKCLVFLRPTQQNIDLLSKELRNPRYGAYYIYFSNIVAKADVKVLAENDEQEVVKEVRELYMDYLAVNPHLFSLGLPTCMSNWKSYSLQRTVQGLIAVLLSLKKCPIIRFQKRSRECHELAQRVEELVNKESTLFAFSQSNQPLLLILDRRCDPVTPLLNQWTYQAMVHELLTINNNRVNLSKVKGISKDLAEVVLSAEQDPFYAKNIFLNFGEIGQNIKELMEHFQSKAKSHQKVESIADMKAFVETYPQFKKLSGNVAKHVTVVGELSSMLSEYELLDVSEVEQEITSQTDHSSHLQSVRKLLNVANNKKLRDIDAVKLVILYGLKYQSHSNNDIVGLKKLLMKRNIPEHLIASIPSVLKYSSHYTQQNDNVVDAVKITKRFFKGLNGVDNVYTQHKPVIHEILEDLLKGRIKEDVYPRLNNLSNQLNNRPQDVIVFMIGGVTYEESLTIHAFNKNYPGTNFVLGGTTIHNSKSFLEEVNDTVRIKL